MFAFVNMKKNPYERELEKNNYKYSAQLRIIT